MEPSEYDTIASLESQHWWYVGMRSIADGWLRRLCLRPGAAILDAGCGTGGGLAWMSALGLVTGIDLHPSAVRYAAHKSRRVAQASVQALPFPTATFDLVTSFEVLYHLEVQDDTSALREMARVLRPRGWLLARVPAHDWLRGAHDRQVHTRHRYTASELRSKAEAAGLRVERLTYVGLLLLPAAVLRRMIQRTERSGSDVSMPPAWLNRALIRMLSTEGRWLRRFDLPAGLSVLLLARKAE